MERLFIAVDIGASVRAALGALQSDLKRAGAKVAWVKPETIHATLVFLGDTAPDRKAVIQTLMQKVPENVPAFSFQVVGTGFFGPGRAPRVIWAGVKDPDGGLAALHEGLAAGLREAGFDVESRPFKPHLTLGRVRERGRAGALTGALASAKNTAFGHVHVDRILLVKSRLEQGGARYSVEHQCFLKGASSHGS